MKISKEEYTRLTKAESKIEVVLSLAKIDKYITADRILSILKVGTEPKKIAESEEVKEP